MAKIVAKAAAGITSIRPDYQSVFGFSDRLVWLGYRAEMGSGLGNAPRDVALDRYVRH